MNIGDDMNRSFIEKIGKTDEDRMLLAKIYDKINAGIQRNIPTATFFLSPGEQEMARYLIGSQEGLQFFGGYADAERKMLTYLPEYLDAAYLWGEDSPIVCLHAEFYRGDTLSHRDLLGALMGAGIARQTVGDICVGEGFADFFVTAEISPFLLQNLSFAGRTSLHLQAVPLNRVQLATPETREIRGTVSSLRLDSVISAGFHISRSLAAQHVCAGRAAIDGIPCEKPDRLVTESTKISVRGLGKIQIVSVGGETRKGRISVLLHRYV